MTYRYELPYEFIILQSNIGNQIDSASLLDIIFDATQSFTMGYCEAESIYTHALNRIYDNNITHLSAEQIANTMNLVIAIIDHIFLFLTSIGKIGFNPIVTLTNDHMALVKFPD